MGIGEVNINTWLWNF